MNRQRRLASSASSSGRLDIIENLWFLLEKLSPHPEGSRLKHFLWALHFMKAYPLQAQGCAAVGRSGRAIDPKTYQKWVWAYIEDVSDLKLEVVSLLMCVIYCILDCGLTLHFVPPSLCVVC